MILTRASSEPGVSERVSRELEKSYKTRYEIVPIEDRVVRSGHEHGSLERHTLEEEGQIRGQRIFSIASRHGQYQRECATKESPGEAMSVGCPFVHGLA